ncbi:MAG: hypothetical protein ABW048_00040, partial [Sphingobium sp.]
MKLAFTRSAILAIVATGLVVSAPADARKKHHSQVSKKNDHGNCLRFNKTTGAVAGAVGGGLLGRAVVGGTGGTLLGAAAGGVA